MQRNAIQHLLREISSIIMSRESLVLIFAYIHCRAFQTSFTKFVTKFIICSNQSILNIDICLIAGTNIILNRSTCILLTMQSPTKEYSSLCFQISSSYGLAINSFAFSSQFFISNILLYHTSVVVPSDVPGAH